MSIEFTVGRAVAAFALRSGERIVAADSGMHRAEIRMIDGSWLDLGAYSTMEKAAKAIYVERPGFSAMYGDA